MLPRNFIKNAALIFSFTLLTGLPTLSAQSMASFSNVKQAQMDLSSTVHLLEQNVLLALTAGVLLLGILWVCYVFKEYAQTNRNAQARRDHFLGFMLVVGMAAFCSSCGLSMQMQAMPSDTAREYIQQGCPHHNSFYQEPFAFTNVYRTIGYPTQQSSNCKFCGQKISNPRN